MHSNERSSTSNLGAEHEEHSVIMPDIMFCAEPMFGRQLSNFEVPNDLN